MLNNKKCKSKQHERRPKSLPSTSDLETTMRMSVESCVPIPPRATFNLSAKYSGRFLALITETLP